MNLFSLHRRRWSHSLVLAGLLTGALLTAAPLCAQVAPVAAYSRARIWLGPEGLGQLQRLGVAVDHGEGKPGAWFESDFSTDELTLIRGAGLRCEVQIADVSAHYRQQNTGNLPPVAGRVQSGLTCDAPVRYPRPRSFRLGSMGGYFTYDQILQKLDSMARRWPNLISVKQPTGPLRTHEGRPLYWVKISDNPNVAESEPQMLYTGVHHAREPMGVSQLLYYMYFLLENYATNPDVRALVNSTELYFVPVVNPDGYVYNATTNPQGGGMWRKNRRDNLDGTFGVDLNRNYGANWGFDDIGSSPETDRETYRGTSAFSEPETQALRDFSLQHRFRLALNYHSFGNLFIYPYGYQPDIYTPDSAQFTDYARWLTRDNRYTYGTGNQTVGYVTNGDSDDWQYSTVQGSKPKTFSFTPEVGKASEGFWPPSSRIEELCHQNLTANYDAARLLLADAQPSDISPRFCRRRAAYAAYSLRQLGLATPSTYTVTITPLTGAGTAGAAKMHTLNAVRQVLRDSIALTLPASLADGQTFRYVLNVSNGLYTRRDTITKVFATPVVAFASSGAALTGFDTNTAWGVETARYHSPPASLADSPGSDYTDNTDNSLTTLPIDLRGATHAQLSFWARWAIETRYDFAQVLISIDNGASFQPLCGRNTRPGNAFQRDGEPLFDGFILNWVPEQINLDDFVGSQILLRFETAS